MKKACLNLDTVGVCASALCTAHCLLFPLFIAAIPLLVSDTTKVQASQAAPAPTGGADTATPAGTGASCATDSCCVVVAEPSQAAGGAESPTCCESPAGFWIHAGFLGIAFPLGLFTWLQGFKQHRRTAIPLLGATGLAVLCTALLLGTGGLGVNGERLMTLCGSALLIGAHLWNRRQCRCTEAPRRSTDRCASPATFRAVGLATTDRP